MFNKIYNGFNQNIDFNGLDFLLSLDYNKYKDEEIYKEIVDYIIFCRECYLNTTVEDKSKTNYKNYVDNKNKNKEIERIL